MKAKDLWATISIDANTAETLELLRKIRQDLLQFVAQAGRRPSLSSDGVHVSPTTEPRVAGDELRETLAFEVIRIFDASAFKHFVHRLKLSVRTHEVIVK